MVSDSDCVVSDAVWCWGPPLFFSLGRVLCGIEGLSQSLAVHHSSYPAKCQSKLCLFLRAAFLPPCCICEGTS